MFYTEPHHLQRGAGVFNVDRYPLQRGRGLGGVFANLLRKVLPFGKTFFKAAASSGKKILQSELGRDILNDTISSAATAATSALIENPKEAKSVLLDSLKRSGKKSKNVLKRMAKDKLDQVLTGGGGKKRKNNRIKHHHHQKKRVTLLDM